MTGIVVKSTGSWYVVRNPETGELYRCRLRGKFKNKGLKVSNPLAVGDVVEFDLPEQSEGAGVIHTITPRRNYIIRRSVHKSEHAHIVAANLDQALLVVTLVSPATSFGFIDRFLVTAEAYHIPALLVFNKSDLYDEDTLDYQRHHQQRLVEIGGHDVGMLALVHRAPDDIVAARRDGMNHARTFRLLGQVKLHDVAHGQRIADF